MDVDSTVLLNLLNQFEINLITGTYNVKTNIDQHLPFSKDILLQNLNIILKNVTNHSYQDVLSMSFECINSFQDFLTNHTPEFNVENGEIKSNYQHIFHSDDNCPYPKQLILLLVAVSALQEFMKANACGPFSTVENQYPVCSALFPDDIFPNDRVLDVLGKNGEAILTRISHPKLLYFSMLLFFSNSFDKCITHKWWLLRCLMIHQRILLESVPELHTNIASLITKQGEAEFLKCNKEPLAEIMFNIECAHAHLHYHEINSAETLIVRAQKILGLEIELCGAVGKRTRFQSKAVAQLLVKTKRKEFQYQSNLVLHGGVFPSDLVLQDDTVLNNIELVDENESKISELLPEEQIVVLAYCCLIQKKMAATELKQEEVMSFVNFLLSQPKVWSLQVKALTIRCRVEKSVTRKFERSLCQLEELINSIKKSHPPFEDRQTALYCVAFPFSYNLEKLLAELFMCIGSIKSALEIYERLQLWEDAVVCYKELGMTLKAVKVLEELIERKPTPLLWCYLGDVTEDPEKYKIAWDLSKHQNARSQRSLGYFYLKKKDFKSSLDHFKLSVEVNHLQPTVWFSLGYAATECQDFELAARAYRQVVSLDSDNFEAWNNLSNAYIKTKQKTRAWSSLQEALKCNFEEWRVWENFLLVSIDIGAFEDVIRAYHRLLDIKGKHVDVEVLRILVNAIDGDLPDLYDLPSSRLKDKTLKLFGRLTSITTNNPSIWELYSILQCPKNLKGEKKFLEQAVNHQHKAIRYYCQDSSWEQSINPCKLALTAVLRFADLLQLLEDPSQKQKQKSSTIYSLKSIVTRADKACSRFTTEDCPTDMLAEAKNALETIESL